MSRSKETLTVLAGHLCDALRAVLLPADIGDIAVCGITIALVPANRLSVKRRGRSASVPVREVTGFWFESIAVDGRVLAFANQLFRPAQPVEIVAERTELILRGPGFRLCIKRLDSAAPRAGAAQRRR